MIVGWLENSAFSVREVQSDGTLIPLDQGVAALALHANEADLRANQSGAVGITARIAARRVQQQNTGGLALELREAAYERAAVPILDKLQGSLATPN